METPRTPQEARHNADRGARELYRYFQPAAPDGLIPSWLSAREESFAPSGHTIGTPISDGSNRSNSTGGSEPATSAIGSDTLIIGTSNSTLTAFAQLAALRLNVERVFISVLDRENQHIVAEATQSLNLNDSSVHDENEHVWLGTPDTRKAWNLCKVSSLIQRAAHNKPSLKPLHHCIF